MADTPDPKDIRKELEAQIADLKDEIARIGKSVSARGEALYDDIAEGASDAYDTASRQARGAARKVRRQAHAVSDVMKENPGTAATVLSSAGLLGFLVGIVVGQALAGNHSRRWY